MAIHSICFGQRKPDQVIPVKLGENMVSLHIFQSKIPSSTVYAHVHENEETSLIAGIEMIDKYGGKIVSLSHSNPSAKQRNVSFKYRGSLYQFDPNRIYTDDDAKLKSNITVVLGKGIVTNEVMMAVRTLANRILEQVEKAPMIIALHNNRNAPPQVIKKWFRKDVIDPESYNVTSYVKKCGVASESNQSCEEIYINPKSNNSEFLIVTKKEDFEKIRVKKMTVVLQNQTPIDDGSMSVWAAKNNKRYINTEAKHGHMAEQKQMLDLLLAAK
jgi:hypothetical protein